MKCLSCYVEQTDVHEPFATVREALEFSADLRLPATVPAARRAAFVGEVRTTTAGSLGANLDTSGAADICVPLHRRSVRSARTHDATARCRD